MKIGLISDTHNNEEFVRKAVRYLLDEEWVEKIYHLGDEWDDVEIAREEGAEVITVPGIYAEQYKDPEIPNKIIEEINGVSIILVHDLNDLTQEDIDDNDVILCGHTHSFELTCVLNKLHINPGHLKEMYHKGRIATFGLLKVGKDGVKAKILDINLEMLVKIDKRIY